MSRQAFFSIIIGINVFISVICQLMLKEAAMKEYESALKAYLNPLVMVSYGVFFLITVVNVYCLKYVPLSVMALIEITSYIYAPLLGYVFFHEKIKGKKCAGMALIIVGILIFLL